MLFFQPFVITAILQTSVIVFKVTAIHKIISFALVAACSYQARLIYPFIQFIYSLLGMVGNVRYFSISALLLK